MNEREYDTEEELFTEYRRAMDTVEEEREKIERELKRVEDQQGQLDEIFRQMHFWYKDVVRHCDEEYFLITMDQYEDEYLEQRRKIERELEEKKDDLTARQNDTYTKGDLIRKEYKRKQIKFIDDRAEYKNT